MHGLKNICHPFTALCCGALMLLTATSCSSFLDTDTSGQLTEEEAYANIDALRNNTALALYAFVGGNADYQGLQGTGRGVYDLNTLTTDEQMVPIRGGDWYDGGMWQGLFLHTYAGAPLKDVWDYLFKVITLANGYLDVVDRYAQQHGEDGDTHAIRAEIRALRAMFLFYTMDLFGSIPLVTQTGLRTDELTLAPRSTTYRFIVSELQDVLDLLPAGRSAHKGEVYGRMTQDVACFLLAKLAINAEVYADDDWTDGLRPDGSALAFDVAGQTMNAWQMAEHFCDRIAASGYVLEDDFAYNFSTHNEESRENIFTIPMDPTRYANWYTYFYRSRHYSHGAALGGASENGPSATIDILRAFRYGEADEDPRFALTFYAGTVVEDGEVVFEDDGRTPLVYHPWEVRLDLTNSPYEKTAGARMGKYAPDPQANADGRACRNDIVLFRYADVLLMKAEARVRQGLSGDDQLAAVRARVGLPPIPATLTSIEHERRLELALEGWRRNDMVRFGLYTEPYTERPQLPGEATGYTTVFPIHDDLMAMHPGWQQNPGY